MRWLPLVITVVLLHAAPSFADEKDPEIDYLLKAIGSSECIFVRNDKRHSAEKAEEHLRMKYKRGRRYATSAETFIKRLASKSSMTRRLYMMECSGAEPIPTGIWLTQQLQVLRDNIDSPT